MNHLEKEGIRSEIRNYKDLKYIKAFSKDYEENKKYPVLVFLRSS